MRYLLAGFEAMPTLSPSLGSITAALVAVALATTTGCAGLTPSPVARVDLDAPAMRQFAVASTTDLERDVRVETGNKRNNERLTPTLFWTGIGLGTLGAAGGVGFGVAGFVTKNQLNDAYYEHRELSLAERDRMVANGELFNTLSIVMTSLAVVGYALAAVAYGVDWNRCGPLTINKSKRACPRSASLTR